MGTAQPFLYAADRRSDARFPTSTFDPKAVTRASWEPKPRRPKQDGPLVSFNRHPDAHQVMPYRSNPIIPLGVRTKSWIKWLRLLQLLLRLLELAGGAGILVLMTLIKEVDEPTTWAMRVLPGVTIFHCTYATYHLFRGAAGRTPASSAAYHLFAVLLDVFAVAAYVFGAFTVHKKAGGWTTRLNDQNSLDLLIPAVYYTLIGAGGLHVISLSASLWLGWVFRRISFMPPDMNPLEDHLTARPFHKRNKSSLSTTSTSLESDKRMSSSYDDRRGLVQHYGEVSYPPTIPFMHTRTQSQDSSRSTDSRVNLPTRQYQIRAAQRVVKPEQYIGTKHRYAPDASHRSIYAGLPLRDPNLPQSDPSPYKVNGNRDGKFTETWLPTDSLISRTNQRNRAIAKGETSFHPSGLESYRVLPQRYDLDDSTDSECEDENHEPINTSIRQSLERTRHPNPLRSNPLPLDHKSTRPQTPLDPSNFTVLSGTDYPSSADTKPSKSSYGFNRDVALEQPATGDSAKRQRDSSIQLESDFYAKPYGELKCATPPILVGNSRKISSGNDYASKYISTAYGRRNVSGKITEEGRADVRSLAGQAW